MHEERGTAQTLRSARNTPILGLAERINSALMRMGDAHGGITNVLDRVMGDEPPRAERENTKAPREVFPFNGELAELELSVTRLEQMADGMLDLSTRASRLT